MGVALAVIALMSKHSALLLTATHGAAEARGLLQKTITDAQAACEGSDDRGEIDTGQAPLIAPRTQERAARASWAMTAPADDEPNDEDAYPRTVRVPSAVDVFGNPTHGSRPTPRRLACGIHAVGGIARKPDDAGDVTLMPADNWLAGARHGDAACTPAMKAGHVVLYAGDTSRPAPRVAGQRDCRLSILFAGESVVGGEMSPAPPATATQIAGVAPRRPARSCAPASSRAEAGPGCSPAS